MSGAVGNSAVSQSPPDSHGASPGAGTPETARAVGRAVEQDAATEPKPARSAIARFGPLALFALAAAGAIYAFGDQLSFEALAANREALLTWRDANYAAAAALFFVAYAAVVALSVPGAVWMTLGGGFLFGLWPGVLLNVGAATLGATAIFLIAKTSLGESLRARAGGWIGRIEKGFRENEISYLLIMRLVPAVPFFIANLAPAFLGVRLRTFVWTTFAGILPGGAVYTWVGAGLGDVFDAGGTPDLSIIFEPHVLGPLLGLAALSALPILIKALRRAEPQS